MKFKMDLKVPTLPSGFMYGYKSNKTTNPYFKNIELSNELRDEPYCLIPIYKNNYLEVTSFNNFIEYDVYSNNDFIDYKDNTFNLGFNKLGNSEVSLVDSDTGCAFLIEEEIKASKDMLTEISYFEFLDLVKKIEEYKDEDPSNELKYVTGLGGKFYRLDNKAILVLERISKDYIYVSYLAIFKEYRKQGNLEKIFGALKHMYPKQKLTLAVINEKIKNKYIDLGFIKVGYLKNYA